MSLKIIEIDDMSKLGEALDNLPKDTMIRVNFNHEEDDEDE